MLNTKKGHLLVLALCLLAVMYKWDQGTAVQTSNVGVLDLELIWSQEVLPALEEPLQEETQRLQKELNAKLALTPESDREALFEEYQGVLRNIQQEYLDAILLKVQRGVEVVAKTMDIDVVVDKQLVIYGGVDVTQAVLQELASVE